MSADSMRHIHIDGHLMTYTAAGDPSLPPLFLVHGWGSYHGVWRQTIEELQTSYFCVAVDLLGFGDSDKPSDADYSIEAQGQRILCLADQLGVDQFSLIGHSMGGQIALTIAALLEPQRVSRLISVSGVVTGRLMPFVENITYRQIAIGKAIPWLYDLTRRLIHYRWVAYWQYRPWFHKMDTLPFEDWKTDREMILQAGGQTSLYYAGQAIHAMNLTKHLPHITAPTLAIFGAQDGTVPVSDGYLVRDCVPDSKLVLLDECGHFPMYEQPQLYLKAVRQFMQS